MEDSTKRAMLYYLAAAALGAALHFLFAWLPNPLTALVSPVRESVWEHVTPPNPEEFCSWFL